MPTAETARGRAALPGPLLFARYAYPPNELGFCGSADSRSLLEYGAAGVVDPGLTRLARAFAGAWPYLELIAHATGIGNPLDARVVEAYWVGNELLDRVGAKALGDSMEDRFRARVGLQFGHLIEAVEAGGVPHHSYAVFAVYPWVGLLGDDRKAAQALTVLDRCRIRWGQVRGVHGDQVVVSCRKLSWDGRNLALGLSTDETAVRAVDGVGFVADLQPGDWVSLHWNWVCDRLGGRQLAALQRYTKRQLQITNTGVTHSGAVAALG